MNYKTLGMKMNKFGCQIDNVDLKRTAATENKNLIINKTHFELVIGC